VVTALHAGTYLIALMIVGGILARPWRLPEWSFACAGALCLVLVGAVGIGQAWHAVAGGWQIYLFLVGVLALAELAKAQGVFAWLSTFILRGARGSRLRLFAIVFAIGVVVTATLSNDSTVIVLTPAVLAILARMNVPPLPYLYACAFVSNAASFALPVGNPANLVIYGSSLPPLLPWLAAFWLPASIAIVATFGTLWFAMRSDLNGTFSAADETAPLSRSGRAALFAVGLSAFALILGSALGAPVGTIAFVCALLSLTGIALVDSTAIRPVLRGIPWGIVPLVAGLFVLVAALDRAGALAQAQHALAYAESLPVTASSLALAGVVTVACNVFNNLPVSLFAGAALQQGHLASHVGRVVLIAVDLGPNLSLTGSLATLLWLIVVRREGIVVSPWRFLGVGAAVTVPALVLAVLVVR
jgi:arsenical pump membrane protein